MKYSAVERVDAVISENSYVSTEVQQKKTGLRGYLKKMSFIDMAIIAVSVGFLVSLSFMFAGIVKALSTAEPLVNSLLA